MAAEWETNEGGETTDLSAPCQEIEEVACPDVPCPDAQEEDVQEVAGEVVADESRVSKRQLANQEKIAKRPRWGDKSFEEITLGDVEQIVRKCNALEKKMEAANQVVQQFKESQKREKDLERQIVEVGPEMIARVKAAISKQLLAQMTYVFAWNSELKGNGRSITAFVPNVSSELLVALGGELGGEKQKIAQQWFDKAPTKGVPPAAKKSEKPGGSGLVLGRYITLAYVKTKSELQVMTTYKFGTHVGKGGGKGCKKARNSVEEVDVAADGDDDGEEEKDDAAAASDEEPDKVMERVDVLDAVAVGGQ
jgi:hypothetical protein